MLKRFNLRECKACLTPMEDRIEVIDADVNNVLHRELVGSLTYLSQTSRPDITFATSYLSRFLDCPTCPLWNAAKRVLHYVKGTIDKNLVYEKRSEECARVVYTDSDWGGDKTDRKSYLGRSKKQQAVALSSAEAKYTSCNLAALELLYLKGLLSDFVGDELTVKCCLLVDNKAAVHMMRNYENTRRLKHIDIKFHFLKDVVAKNLMSVEYVES
ncbi:hypothetical protein PR048_022173, partial [Dryococelus australis]